MELVEISKNQLNRFVGGQDFSQFLQSWEWGEFQKKSGFEILRLGVEEKGGLVGVATLIKKNLGMGQSYFYCPRGPIVNNIQYPTINNQTTSNNQVLNNRNILEFLFEEIKRIARNEKVLFLRFESGIKYPLSIIHYPITKTIDVQPAKTIILDLTKTEDELLNAMHQKTRYNIRLAERKGVKVRIVDAQNFTSDFEMFWQIMEETVKRDKFRLHSKEHYRRMLQVDNNFVKLILAEYQGKIIAGNILIFFGDTATYVHGASANEYRNAMAPFSLQWKAIKLAQEQGYKYYDFYGIDEDKWPGVTRFKKGFGGKEINLPGTYDLIFNKKWYKLYKFFRSVRRLTS
ncbi:hypothetical protein DRH27_01380 [Candidatus Falkowbacteria bacterium]|nr:MAG: hypothetical protein DRH27_01380 [Candidatus Falkowbacteria bacterium]